MLRGMVQDCVDDLGPSHAGEPRQELLHRSAALQIIEECTHRHARAAKDPGAAQLAGIPLNRRTRPPIEH